jgi:NAD(P)-dependent dehydrogenase (short-subunit alcohol dehydrogenase family)
MTQSALIIGAGDATGGAIARAFAREGLIACVNRRARNADKLEQLAQSIRNEGHQAMAFPGDAREEEEMAALIDRVEAEAGPLAVAVFNIGANVNFPITETSARVYRKVWEMACFGGFLMGREVAKRMEHAARARSCSPGRRRRSGAGQAMPLFPAQRRR